MPIPTIDDLPPAPTRSMSNDEFIAAADAFVAALPPLVGQINDWSAAVAALAAELGVGDASEAIAALAGLTPAADRLPLFTGAATATLITLSAFAQTLLDDPNAAAMRVTLGLAALATKATVNNGDWSGTPLSVANGGTGGNSAAAARSNLGIDASGNGGLVPSGAIMPFAMNAPPSGWLECDGSAVSRSTYATLFAAVGTVHGAGNGSTTFNLPDLRGEFVRGWDHGRGADAGRTFGSAQADDLKAHTHSFSVMDNDSAGGGFADGTTTTSPSGTVTTSSTGGTETRPRNIALMYCVKV